MGEQTRSAGGGSALGRLLALALTFAVGYVLGSRTAGEAESWESEREPTRITIDDDGDGDVSSEESGGSEASDESGEGGESEAETESADGEETEE